MKDVLLLAVLLAAVGARAESASYGIDPTHTFANFEVLHQGLSTLRGRFDRKQGSIRFDRSGRSGQAEITIELRSVNTGVPALDNRLRGPGFFDVETSPEARFVGDRFVFEGDRITEVSGTLTLAGRSAPLALKATNFNCYFSPLFKREVCGGDFEATLLRSQWRLGEDLGTLVADEVRLRLQVEAVRQ